MGRFPFSASLIIAAIGLLVFFAVGCGSGDSGLSEDSPQAKAAIAQYRSFLQHASQELTEATRRLLLKVEGGELTKAESRYAATRVFYGQLLSAVALFDGLGSQIDPLPGEVPPGELGGFHRIEKALWVEHTASGMTPVARKLYANVKGLRRQVNTVDLRDEKIAAIASQLLDEISTSTLTGKEEPYSHIDLVDISARIESAEAAFDAVKPLLTERDSELVRKVEAGFAKIYATLKPYGVSARRPDQPRAREPGIIFVIYGELSAAAIHELAQPIDALAKLFSQVPPQLAQE